MRGSATRGSAQEEDVSSDVMNGAAPAASGPAPSRSKSALLLVAVVAVVVVIAVVVGGSLLRDGGSSAAPLLASSGRWVTQPGPTDPPDVGADWQVDFACDKFCSLITTDEHVFAANTHDLEVGSETEVMAHDSATGEEVWDRPVRIAGYSLPYALEDGDVIVSGAKELRRIDATTGEARWRADGHFVSASEGIIVVGDYGEFNRRMVDAETGDTLWEGQGGVKDCGGGVVVVAAEDGITRVDARTGEEVWRFPIDQGDVQAADVALCSDRLLAYVSDPKQLTVLDLSTGEEVDTIDIDVDLPGSGKLEVVDDLVLVMGGGQVVAYEPREGALAEAWTVDGPEGYVTTYVRDDTMTLVEISGKAQILDLSDGSVRGSADVADGEEVTATTESLLVHADGAIRALQLSDASLRWRFDVDGLSQVAVSGERLLVIAGDEIRAYS